MTHAVNQRHENQSASDSKFGTMPGIVLQYTGPNVQHHCGHQNATWTELAKKLAFLKGYDFAGQYDPAQQYAGRLYFVPTETLVGVDAARKLGICSEEDLFGGIVPFPFVATKTITHPLVDSDAFAPEGWSYDFSRRVQDAVLFGFTAFTLRDARRAGALVLERGVARVKPARGVGGQGQTVVSQIAELDAALETIDAVELSRDGIVIEQNFEDITTYSIGQVRVSDLVATYCGTQRQTTDNEAADVYGGSDLVVVRGDYETLLDLDLAPELRLAIKQARTYDIAASQEFPGLMASRRNYDVAQVVDAGGQRRLGVLEQSWRIGGASAAELSALEAFRAEPTLRASCREVYGPKETPPPQAVVYFHGVDDGVGPIIKYTVVEPYGNRQ